MCVCIMYLYYVYIAQPVDYITKSGGPQVIPELSSVGNQMIFNMYLCWKASQEYASIFHLELKRALRPLNIIILYNYQVTAIGVKFSVLPEDTTFVTVQF